MSNLILDLTRLLPGPLACRMLGELGFEVLRLLPPSGDMADVMMPELSAWLNAAKRTETIDLKTPEGCQRLKGLASEALALVETNRPGVMEKLGVGPEILRQINPNLTYVRLAGFRNPEQRAEPGHDLTYLAATGLLSRFEPAWRSVQLADISGSFWAVIATLQGLRQGGGFFEVYLEEAAFPFSYPPLTFLDGSILCYRVYPAREGQVALGALEPHLWARFCKAVNHPEWQTEGFSRAEPTNATFLAISEFFLEKTAQEWETVARQDGYPLRAVQTFRPATHLVPWNQQNEE
ncbi:MAG TPA: CoA transferase [Acidobacteriota bacterium]|nr:CoA transferase [Acidobacteriota bacterium]